MLGAFNVLAVKYSYSTCQISVWNESYKIFIWAFRLWFYTTDGPIITIFKFLILKCNKQTISLRVLCHSILLKWIKGISFLYYKIINLLRTVISWGTPWWIDLILCKRSHFTRKSLSYQGFVQEFLYLTYF